MNGEDKQNISRKGMYVMKIEHDELGKGNNYATIENGNQWFH